MLKIHTMALGMYQTNCYIIHEENAKTCCVIDPGYDAGRVLNQVRQLGLTVGAILLTHGHFDHVGAVRDIAADTGCRVFICPEDLSMPEMMTAGPLYYTDTYGEGDTLSLAGLTIHVIHTPGHTPGSVCLLTENAMFSGDTLFAGSCGRVDLPGGDWSTILRSLKRLAAMQTDFDVYPGHAESTTLSREKRYNPYMR